MPRFTFGVPRSSLVASLIFLLLFYASAVTSNLHAAPIGKDAFGLRATVEGFEGLSPAANSPQVVGTGFLKPGVIGPFTFASGATLTGPVPNPGLGMGAVGVLVGDFSLGASGFGLGENGRIDSANDVPHGTAFIALNAHPGPIEFTFPFDLIRVGAFEAGDAGFVTLSAFDASGRLLETLTLAKSSEAHWTTTFIGLENAAGIRKVTFTDSTSNTGFNALVLDDLTFEPLAAAVPEPPSILLVAAAVMTLAACLRLRRVPAIS